jgi:FixJ family two-component response regulator
MRCYDSLTQRERNVTDLIVRGYRNKDIATQMSLSEATVKTHRNQAMKKMGSTSLAEFVLKMQAIDVDSKDTAPRALKLLR